MTTNDQMMTQRKHQRVSPEVRWEDETTHCDAGSSDRLDRWCHGNVCLCWWLTAGTIWRLTHSERQAHLIQENNTWQIAIRISRFIIKRNLHLSANGKGRFKTSSLGQSWGGAIFFSFCSHYQHRNKWFIKPWKPHVNSHKNSTGLQGCVPGNVQTVVTTYNC